MIPQRTNGSAQGKRTGAGKAGLPMMVRRLHVSLHPSNGEPDLELIRAIAGRLTEITAVDDEPRPNPARTRRRLTGRPGTLLTLLLDHAGTIHTPEELARAIRVNARTTNVIKVYICYIRAELARHGLGDVIETERGVGYRITRRNALMVRSMLLTSGLREELQTNRA